MSEQPIESQEVTAAERPTRGRILVIDDEADIREGLEALLELEGYTVLLADCAMDGLRKLEAGIFDLVLLDLMMPDRSGIDLLGDIRARDIETPVFLITAFGSIDVAVQALKAGANDYFSKPWDNDKLVLEIDRQIAGARLERENRELRRALKQRYAFPNIVGKSERMQRVLDLVSQVAPSKSNILITGETGTGKELIARAIHFRGVFANRPFVAVDCGSLVPTLIESELFGYEKGAFTGALKSKQGLFQSADTGSVFLDEIGELPLELQAKLLCVLQEKEVRPVGSNQRVKVDVRIIAATNRDLEAAYKNGTFRKDLYFRLNVITVHVPALRERRSDIPMLVNWFCERYAPGTDLHVSNAAMKALMNYDWPGNVRELENCVERAVALGNGNVIDLSDLPPSIAALDSSSSRSASPSAPEFVSDLAASAEASSGQSAVAAPLSTTDLEDIERATIQRVFEQVKGDKALAGRMLGISRATLYRKLKRYNISGGAGSAPSSHALQ